jgi:glyoxylate/hydroxypyruvate reductase A
MPGAILLAITSWDPAPWIARFQTRAAGRDIRVWPDDIGDPANIEYICAWKPPSAALTGLPNLKAIFSLGAGVDHLIGDPALPDVPVVRIVDRDLTQRMTEYVVLHTLIFHRRQRLYGRQQRGRVWFEHDQPAAHEVAVGIMGLGELGSDAAEVLRRIGFQVAGWSRRPKTLSGVKVFHGQAGLDAFLARTEILVTLLPHTPATTGILYHVLFSKLKRDGALGGAYLINAGRGKLQVDDDIVAALDSGILSGAALDVFPTEPLPQESPLWRHDKVTVTPHNAAVSNPDALVEYVLRQIARHEAGQPLENTIDRTAGY